MEKDYHNQGQQDRSEGKYENPHGLIDSLVNFVSSSDDEWAADIRESESYDKGWTHTDKQLDKGWFNW